MAQCTAKSKRSGEQCRKQAMIGRDKCHMHGGKTPRGLAHPRSKTGRWSRYLKTGIGPRVMEALSDPKAMELDHEIALVDARIGELLGRVDTGEAKDHFTQITKLVTQHKKALNRYKGAIQSQDVGGMTESIGEIERVAGLISSIAGGQLGDYAAWEEVGTLIERRRKLVETERKYQIEQDRVLTEAQVMLMLGTLEVILRKHIVDDRVLSAIGQDIDGAIILESKPTA